MKTKTSIVLTGVWGQGVITAANILGQGAIKANITVYVSEVHGMAQRGGAVNCSVRMGDVSGPLVARGTADALVGMEPIETLRCIHYTNKKTCILTDIATVVPFTVSVGSETYPDVTEVFKELETYGKLYKIDATKIAKDAGGVITKNIVMLGALSATNVIPFTSDILLETILEKIPQKYHQMNKKAFENGMNAIY